MTSFVFTAYAIVQDFQYTHICLLSFYLTVNSGSETMDHALTELFIFYLSTTLSQAKDCSAV